MRAQIRVPVSWLMAVTRSDRAVTFDYDVRTYPTDDVQETVTVDGNEFTAKSDSWPLSSPSCPDGTVLAGTFSANVTRRFSDDGQHITAEEAWSYQFSSGAIDFHLDESADQ